MSPNEAQLRAALQAGEGDSLDVDTVVSGAVQVQRARRHRLASAVGAVIVVAGVAGGSAALLGRDGGGNGDTTSGLAITHQPAMHSAPATAPSPGLRERTGAAAGGGSERAASRTASAPASVPRPGTAASDGASAAISILCPARLPRLALAGGGGTGQFGGHDPLFGASVGAVKVCLYQGGTSVVGASQVLTGGQAADLATSLNGASATRGAHMCPNIDNGVGDTTLAIYAVTPSGHRLRVVTASLGCRGVVTNGTATRYSWSPPSSLTTLVHNHTARNTPASPSN